MNFDPLVEHVYAFSELHDTNMGGGSLASGNVASQALITLSIFPSDPADPRTLTPNALPFNEANPRGTVAMGNPAEAATLAMRASAGPRMASMLWSERVFSMAEVA